MFEYITITIRIFNKRMSPLCYSELPEVIQYFVCGEGEMTEVLIMVKKKKK